MEFDYVQLAFYINGILALLIGGVIIYLIKQVSQLGKTGLETFKEKSPVLYDIFLKIVKNGVFDAELAWLKSEIQDKEAYAIQIIERELEKYGLLKFFSVEEIVRQIKLTVYQEFNKDKTRYQVKK